MNKWMEDRRDWGLARGDYNVVKLWIVLGNI